MLQAIILINCGPDMLKRPGQDNMHIIGKTGCDSNTHDLFFPQVKQLPSTMLNRWKVLNEASLTSTTTNT